ncbi:head-tail connector protein [Xanthomonas sp. A1809]|uniref:head-tail connector protein n=1 Tax=Xanthomonas sp. A1809 TaxID=2821275 RepID=UPI001AD9816C|nr:head-tail connector protein [Xanthomonas sp. A1809]MBO9859390.1 phage gp6-like head-tail connector protein [Xanthomonas sp. A1809]
MRIVTETQVRAHVRLDGDDESANVYAEAAEQAAQDFLNRQVYKDTDSLAAAVLDGSAGFDPMVANPAIIAAVLLITGHLYRNREAVTDETANQLPLGAHALLWPHRVGLGV